MGDLTNYTESTAFSYLNRLEMGLNIRVEREFSDEIEEGKVISTDPEQGAPLEEGQMVTLYISKGPEIKTGFMPNVVDVDQELAIRTLENLELKLEFKTEEIFDEEIEEGNVVKTDPERGDELQTGQTVTLYISKGPQTEIMPNLVGGDLDTALELLKELEFADPVVEYVFSEEPENTIISQSVPKNEKVSVKIEIKLEVSKGPEPTEPPENTKDVIIDLQGETSEGAMQVQVVRQDGVVVFSETVAHGQEFITIPDQTGTGIVSYQVYIEGQYVWEHQEDFTNDAA